jgi:catechol 2,3-dioxygenase-like lactoylglutathione lyase family enzyme
MFCSDYELGANVMCNTWDEGADLYEMTSKWVERFDTSYVWTNFRRDRFNWGINNMLQGKERYLSNMPNVYQQWLFNIFFLQSAYQLTSEQMDEFFGLGDPIWQNYWTMAVTDSTNLLLRQLTTPSTGYHGKLASGTWVYLPTNKTDNGRLAAGAEATYIANAKSAAGGSYVDVAYVPRGPGRSMYSVYDTNGYDGFTRTNEVGHFWDQRLAIAALTSSETNFLGVDRGSDALKYSLPYYMTFNRELAPLFRDVWAENTNGLASSLSKLADGTAVVVPATPLHADTYILGFNYPPPAPVPVDGNVLAMDKVLSNPTWGTRFYTEVLGMMFFTDNFNQEYASFNQVYRLGSGEALAPTDNYTAVNFPDPANQTIAKSLPPDLVGGYVYAGLRQNTGPVYVGTPAAVLLIDRANVQAGKYYDAKTSAANVDGFSAAQWEAKLRETVRSLEMMRSLYDIFGRTW